MRNTSLLVGLMLTTCLPTSAAAQASRLDVGIARGHVYFSDQFDVQTVGLTAGVWFTERFGVAWSMNVGKDTVPYPQVGVDPFPERAGDRRRLDRGNVRLQRMTLRYRRPLWSSSHLLLGGGLLISASTDQRYLLAHTLSDIEERRHRDRWGGLSFEALLRQRVAGPLSVEAGLIKEGALDRGHVHPVVQVTYGF